MILTLGFIYIHRLLYVSLKRQIEFREIRRFLNYLPQLLKKCCENQKAKWFCNKFFSSFFFVSLTLHSLSLNKKEIFIQPTNQPAFRFVSETINFYGIRVFGA